MSIGHSHGHSHGHGHGHAHGAERGALTSKAAIFSVLLALFLITAKGYASWETDSLAMLGSLADSGLDFLASVITLLGVRWAAMPADEEHRFGHGKAEALAAMVQVVIISLSALAIAFRSIQRFIEGGQVQEIELGIQVSVLAMAMTFALLVYQRMVIRKTGSVAIVTDHLHYKSDLALNASVIAALLLDAKLGLSWADPLFGLIIAIWLGWGAYRAASQSVDQLMDREWDEDRREALAEIIQKHPHADGIHELRTRTSGGQDFIQFHLSLDPKLSLSEVHDIMDEVEARIHDRFPAVEVLIHPDPVGLVEPGQEPAA